MNLKKLFLLIFSIIIVLSLTLSTSAETVNIELWTFINLHGDYYEMKAEEFDEAHPDIDFNLDVQSYPFRQIHDKLNMALQTGVGAPDIVDMNNAYSPGVLANESARNELVSLNSLVEKYEDNIIQKRLDLYTVEGTVYGIPTHVGTGVIFYNKELFDEAGISVDSIETWDDYIEAGKKLTKDTNNDGEIDQWMTAVPTAYFWSFNMMSRQLGSNIFDEEGNIIIDRDENVKVMQTMQDMVYEHEIADIITAQNDPNFYSRMNNGEFASILPMPQWFMSRITEFMPDLEGKMVVRPIPAWSPNGSRSAMGGGTGTAITKQSENIEIAKEYLEYAKLTRQANIDIWTYMNFDPFRKDVYDSPEVNEPLPFFNNENVMGIIKELQPQIKPLYLTKQYPEVRTVMEEETLYQIIQEERDPKTVLQETKDKLQSSNN